MSIAVVVPTCRAEQIEKFKDAWADQFDRHDVDVLIVRDDTPEGVIQGIAGDRLADEALVLGGHKGIVARQSPACRCLGFAYIARYLPNVEYIVTLDDDVAPSGDTIGDHVAALNMRGPVSWLSTVTSGPHMRGFPYGVRGEAPVMVSHGVWEDIPDLDAPTQLVLGDRPEVEFYRGIVPRGVYFPVCGMNIAFRREVLPYALWCPARWLKGAERFDDIWMGIYLLRALWSRRWALATGYASCVHTRLSNTFKNLQQEAVGIGVNEALWKGEVPEGSDAAEFLRRYEDCLRQWRELCDEC